MFIVTIPMGCQIGNKSWHIVPRKLTGLHNVMFMLLNPNAFKNLFELSVRFYLNCVMGYCNETRNEDCIWQECYIIPYPTAFPYGNGMVLHFYQQQESSTTKTVHKVINKGPKAYV